MTITHMYGYCPLGSGSKGNCIYFGTPETKILIDAGLSGKQIKLRLATLGVDISEIDAIIISHEHHDHIQGLRVLAFRHEIPVICNSETAKGIVANFDKMPQFKIFSTGETFEFRDIQIDPFSIQHDALDPVAFTLNSGGQKFGFCTDLGMVTGLVEHHLRDCDFLYVEANHEPHMVHASPRPMVYKQRVLGRSGHLSNEACGQLIQTVAGKNLKYIHLAHLSSECNAPGKALEVVGRLLEEGGLKVPFSVAPQASPGQAIQLVGC